MKTIIRRNGYPIEVFLPEGFDGSFIEFYKEVASEKRKNEEKFFLICDMIEICSTQEGADSLSE